MLEMKKIREIGAEKMMKTLEGHELGKGLLKEEAGGKILSGEDDVLVEDVGPGDKIGKVF